MGEFGLVFVCAFLSEEGGVKNMEEQGNGGHVECFQCIMSRWPLKKGLGFDPMEKV